VNIVMEKIYKKFPWLNYRYSRRVSHKQRLVEQARLEDEEVREVDAVKIKLHKINKQKDSVIQEGAWADLPIYDVVKGKLK